MKINELPSEQQARILEYITSHPNSHGFGIAGATQIPIGSVYVQLRKLEESGLIVSQKSNRLSGTQSDCRVTYTLTQKGRKVCEIVVQIWETDPKE